MTSERRRPDWWGRGIGLATFLLGTVLLVLVLIWTFSLPIPEFGDGKRWQQEALNFGGEAVKRFVGGLLASWIAASGARLYAAANRTVGED